MSVTLNTGFYHNSCVERVVNPNVTDVNEDKAKERLAIEQAQPDTPYSSNGGIVRTDQTIIDLLDKQQEQQRQDQERQRTTLDQPNRNARMALNAYHNIADGDKKQAFSALVGVDIYV